MQMHIYAFAKHTPPFCGGILCKSINMHLHAYSSNRMHRPNVEEHTLTAKHSLQALHLKQRKAQFVTLLPVGNIQNQ